ncbi:hypothetical protein OIDMADRAFT_17509 [Oidiodendron maius Zn]|uniref:Uncharacterized protein n=1 Tax=Oidiodendron maius (strain Zn) TaxID=913774 RepID=A0A0C3H879_OIDMZ|nr:hypothetical protein OIDMADRAFT_17509 [Oidiodendron maius Zn]
MPRPTDHKICVVLLSSPFWALFTWRAYEMYLAPAARGIKSSCGEISSRNYSHPSCRSPTFHKDSLGRCL